MEAAPGDARKAAIPFGLVTVAHALAVDKVTSEVAAAMQREGIDPILIKGPTTGDWLYDADDARSYTDSDLVVSPAQQADAARVLGGLGFERQSYWWEVRKRLFHAGCWYRPPDKATVDLHLTLPGVSGASPEEVWEVVSRETVEWPLPNRVKVRTTNLPARALLVALHAVHHIDHGSEERPLADLTRAVERGDLETWTRAAELAVELRSGADLARALHAVDGGAELAAKLRLAAPATGYEGTVGIERILATRSRRERARAVRRALFPSPSYLRYTLPHARRGRGWLALAYVRRPFALAIRFPEAYRLWRASTKGR